MNGGIAAEALRQFVERIERLEEEKKAIASDIKDVYAQLSSQGFDKKVVRKVVTLRRMDDSERREEEQLIELYMAALGMMDEPLSDSTRKRLSEPKPDEPSLFDDAEDSAAPEPPPPGSQHRRRPRDGPQGGRGGQARLHQPLRRRRPQARRLG